MNVCRYFQLIEMKVACVEYQTSSAEASKKKRGKKINYLFLHFHISCLVLCVSAETEIAMQRLNSKADFLIFTHKKGDMMRKTQIEKVKERFSDATLHLSKYVPLMDAFLSTRRQSLWRFNEFSFHTFCHIYFYLHWHGDQFARYEYLVMNCDGCAENHAKQDKLDIFEKFLPKKSPLNLHYAAVEQLS